jgi:hypothetical protein
MLMINTLPKVREFLLHIGDLTHLSDPAQFDTLAQVLKECRTKDVFYVPCEHDIYDNGAQYRERFGKNTIGGGALRRIKSGGKAISTNATLPRGTE